MSVVGVAEITLILDCNHRILRINLIVTVIGEQRPRRPISRVCRTQLEHDDLVRNTLKFLRTDRREIDELASLGIFEGGPSSASYPCEFHNSASAADDAQYLIGHRSGIPVRRAEMRSKNLLPKTTPHWPRTFVGNLV
jgi:hypothetical protein